MWWRQLLGRGVVVGVAVLCAPGVAQAADTAYVNSSGVVVVQGDNNSNQINFAEGSDPGAPDYNYGAAIWDSAPGESVTAGAGCVERDDPEFHYPVAECGNYGPGIAIVVNEGNGAGDTITNNLGPFSFSYCNCDGYFTSITINAGNGGDTILPVSDNDRQGSTVKVNGGNGGDTITIETTNASTVTVNGGAGDDTITGTNGCTCTQDLNGGAGNNTIKAGDGNHVNITVGAGNNNITGGAGNDTINSYNGHRDTVDCNILGNDDVIGDQYDVVNKIDCAGVTIKQWQPGGAKPSVSVSLPSHQHPVKSKKILATVHCSAACYMGAVAEVSIGGAQPFEISSDLYHLAHAGQQTIPIDLTRHQLNQIKAGLRAHKRIRAAVIGVLTDSTGNKLEGQSHPKSLTITS